MLVRFSDEARRLRTKYNVQSTVFRCDTDYLLYQQIRSWQYHQVQPVDSFLEDRNEDQPYVISTIQLHLVNLIEVDRRKMLILLDRFRSETRK